MRNLFDQYDGPENRLTHALACCLAEDRKLLARFVKWATGEAAPSPRRLEVMEQQLPGDPESSEEEAGRRGLPDACIHDGESWCLIIENKVKSELRVGQLRRHQRTVARRGFTTIQTLAITPREYDSRSLEGIHQKKWTDVYRWSRQLAGTSDWARRLVEYLEAAEARMANDGYLQEGTLTTFAGVPFGRDNPYNYLEARRVLGVAMQELRSRQDLVKQLGVDPDAAGRSAITGRGGAGVWDMIRFANTPAEQAINLFPHLTLAVGQGEVVAILVLPSGLKTEFRERLRSLGSEGFLTLVGGVAGRMSELLSATDGCQPWIQVLQRHYRSRTSQPVTDAVLQFDIRSALAAPGRGKRGPVRYQPLWAEAAFAAFDRRRGANLQIGVGARFPYDRCPGIARPEALDHIAAAWIACKPVVDVMFGTGRVC